MTDVDISTEEKGLQKELLKLARNRKFKKKLISFALILLIVFAVILVSWFSGKNHSKSIIDELRDIITDQEKQIQELTENAILVNPVAPEIVMDILESEINNIGELATVEYVFTDAAKFSDSKQIKEWNIPFTEKSFVLKWDGKIKAGIQVDGIKGEVHEDELTIIIDLPDAEILSYEVDNNTFEVIYEKNNIFNNISVEDKITVDQKTEADMKERAIENGLLDMAQKNAEAVISKLLYLNPDIASTYTIKFADID